MTTHLAPPDQPTQLPAGRPPLHPGRPQGERQRWLLMALVDANPGIHILRAAHLLGLNWNTCHHHVRRLVAEDRMVVRKVQGRLCLFDRKEGAVPNRLAPLMLRDERTANLAKLILDNPGTNQKSLAVTLGIAQSAVHRHLIRLEQAGLIQRIQHSREMAAYGTERLAEAWSDPDRGGNASLVPTGAPW